MPQPPDNLDPLIGQSLGEFHILALLGRGGMGAVYKARQASLDRLVAIKVLPQDYARDASFLERFSREARAAAAISHPNIVQVIVVGQDKGYEFIAMELVDGESLSQVLKREGRLPAYPLLSREIPPHSLSPRERAGVRAAEPGAAPDDTLPLASDSPHPPLSRREGDRVVPGALELMRQVASALAKAHAAGVVHRDIKPANILLTSDGLVKVADFGLAKRAGVDVSVTATGASLGTPLYMPPEVAEAKPCDARSDLYSLGATFYHLLAGRPPFEGGSAAELILKHYRAEVAPLGEAAPDAPPALCSIIRRLLRKDPAERFQSASELLDALDRVPQPRRSFLSPRERPPHSLSPRERAGVRAPAAGPAPAAAAPTQTLPGRAAPHPSLSRRERANALRRKLPLIAGGAAGVLLIALVLILRGPSSSTPTPNTQRLTPAPKHPTPSSPKWTVYTQWPFDAAEAKRRQEETAKALGVPVEQDIALGNGVKMTFVLIPAGEFLMGSPPTTSPEQLQKLYGGEVRWYEGEFPQHRVRITKPFWLGKYEVTQEQWQAVMGNKPSNFAGKTQNPVEGVTWDECQQFLQKLKATLKGTFRLPTEAEWEHACRAGTATDFFFGDAKESLGYYAWYPGNSGATTHPVGEVKPNAWRLHDMIGNVREFCEDWFAPYEKGPQQDPKGPGSADGRVLRGGSYNDEHHGAFRCACRGGLGPGGSHSLFGFRAAMTMGVAPEARTGAQAAPPPPDDEARWGPWEELFDGKTLTGWRVLDAVPFAKHGDVRAENGELRLRKGEFGTGALWAGQCPTSDYELSFELKPPATTVSFPVGMSQQWGFMLGDGWVAAGPLRVTNSVEIFGRAGGSPVEKGKWCSVRLRVAAQMLTAWIDGQKRFTSNTTIDPEKGIWGDGTTRPLAVCSWQDEGAIRAIRLRRLKPEGAEAPKGGAWKVYTEWPFDEKEAKRRQEETAKALGVPVEKEVELGNGVKMAFVLVPAGEAMIGSERGDAAERPVHKVTMPKPFYLGKFEVTQEQWQAVAGEPKTDAGAAKTGRPDAGASGRELPTNPSKFQGPKNPVDSASWEDCRGFVAKLMAKLPAHKFRLPSEAEWEYACRAGTLSDFSCGDDERTLAKHAWIGVNSGGKTQPVGELKPNAWGLFDMHGNVWEACEDFFHGDYEEAPADGSAWVKAGYQGLRIMRGGAFYNPPQFCRSANRARNDPSKPGDGAGLRVLMALDQ